ncbi:alkaline phosphatase [Altererythrobacter sp. B11]|uniref:alkaline phosphatase D family protein n=1 Tax=Altererythrobacter sp. B11 TaxID=2060312 RepID=UPI000DC723BE|nr:alkaline phosphatase D family protein [Altererythrobacter sp. B11]BBC74354.1 alkaline phosphatase [Altererythrobacter sp. B11]
MSQQGRGWNRRQAVAALGAGGIAAGLPLRLQAAEPASARFRHGVASGDPDSSSLVIWTRVESDAPQQAVEWQLATDAAFTAVARSGRVTTSADHDYTVKVLVEGLEPGRRYHYRFVMDGEVSPAGRTRTLPTGALDRLGVALVSCSNYPFGYFNAYDAIARDPLVDIVLHTGDYIYEYGADGWGAEAGRKLGRLHEPANEIVSLSDYRTRHAQYRRDAGLQAMTAAHPFIACWDDHESANNPWIGGAENHQPAQEGDWLSRRAASIQAYYEWLPIREPGVGRSRAEFWRSYRFGDLATLVTLETRHTARARQIDYADYAGAFTSKADVEKFRRDVLGAPDRPMLSHDMELFLADALSRSVAEGQPWRVIGNAVPMARMEVPDLVGAGLLPAADTPGLAPAAQALAWKAQWNLPFYTDTWDGYPWARERFYDLCSKAGARDLIVLTGDSHSFWANRLADGAGRPMGIELGTAGVTSPGDFLESGFDRDLSARLDTAFAEMVEEVLWTDNFHQGYVRLDLRPDAAQTSFIGMSTIESPDYRPLMLRSYAIARAGGSVELRGGAGA